MAAEQEQLKEQEAQEQPAEQVEPAADAEQAEPSAEVEDQAEVNESAEEESDQAKGMETSEEGPAAEIDMPAEDVPALAQEDSQSQAQDGERRNLDRILSMRVPVIVRIARKKITLGEVMKFNMGSVIQFEQDADQHIDLMVNNSVIGLGQAVKLGENFGLKITQIADVTDTIKSLGGQN